VRQRLTRGITALGAAIGVSACQTFAGTAMQRAVLLEESAVTMDAIKRVLDGVIREGRLTLGPGDLTRDSVIAVLPPAPGPYEGNSPAMPTYFDLLTDGKSCFLRERGKDDLLLLPGVACRVHRAQP